MADGQQRYFRTQSDIARDLAIKEKNAETARLKYMADQDALAQQQGFIRPGQNMKLASMTAGFDAGQGTAAGGLAYQQGIDFGTRIGVPNASIQPVAPQQAAYAQVAAPEELEQVNLEEFYGKYSQLNQLGQAAARAGVDINNPDPMDPDSMEIAGQYHTLYNELLSRGEALQQGYKATQKAQEKGQIIEQHQGPTQFTDAFDAKKYDFDVQQLNMKAKEFYTRGALGEANEMLFGGPNASIEDAAKNYSGRVGAYFYQADVLESQGRINEANLIRQKMFDVLGGVYDSTKQQGLALKAEDLKRKKDKDAYLRKKDFNKGYKKYESVANLQKKIFDLQNHGEIGFIKQNHPDATYVTDAGTAYVQFRDNKTGEMVTIDVADDEALAAQFMKDNPKFLDVTLADYQEVKQKFGGYQPTVEENWQIKINTQPMWDIVGEIGTLADAEKTTALAKWLNDNNAADFLSIGDVKVTSILAEPEAETLGSASVIFKLADGDEMRFDTNSTNDMQALDELLQTADRTTVGRVISNNPKKYNQIRPKDDAGNEYWGNQGLVNKVKRKGTPASLNRQEEVLNKMESEYNLQGSSSSTPAPATTPTGGGTGVNPMYNDDL